MLTGLLSDYGTFCYIVQPCLCLWLVFTSCENYLTQVDNLARTLSGIGDGKQTDVEPNLILLLSDEKEFYSLGMMKLCTAALTDVT